MTSPPRQIRALHDDQTITVYQAYAPEIAEPAVAAGRFTAGFHRDRMTWIKPSFLWMMYRCGWAAKPGQERVLAIRIRRGPFACQDPATPEQTPHLTFNSLANAARWLAP